MNRLLCLVFPILLSPLAAQDIGADRQIHLRYATFDPAVSQAATPKMLRGGPATKLWIVQFDGLPTEARRAALRSAGAQVHGYLPENAYVVRMSHTTQEIVARQPGVRSATYYHPAFRLEPELVAAVQKTTSDDEPRKYNVVVVDKHTDKPALMKQIQAIGGKVDHEQIGSILLEVSLTRAQLAQAARFDEVLWIDRWTPSELDMNNARIQGGGNHVETFGGFTGKGVNGHIYEGLQSTHYDFNTTPLNVRSSGAAQSHGHCTAGIVFGNGKSNASGRGMAPDARAFYTTYTSVSGSRWQVVDTLVRTHQVMFTTASWGGGRTTVYTSVSADTDDIIFDHDMAWTQSQSNSSSTPSRPQAWAKNIFSIGGVAHRNNSNPADDSWRAGGGSTGPAADGRIKPDLCAYYDSILCSDRTGSSGYSSGDYYTNFGGTSGATPICAGHNAIAIQMFAAGTFSPQRVPNGTVWQNKPHFSTLKALQIANAAQYAFTKTSTDNRREHCGWGFPNLKTMYDRRAVHYVVDETDILRQGEGMAYRIAVPASTPEFKASLCFADLPGNPSATLMRVNDLTLRVTAPNGTRYWGNVGLKDGNYSVKDGARDVGDTVENVFVKNPQAGVWTVQVGAFLVAKDSHVETSTVDADFGLVVVGGKFVSKTKVGLRVGAFDVFGVGCPSSSSCSPSLSRNWTKTSTNATTTATKIAMWDAPNAPTTICGLDLYMGAKTGAVDLNVSIYDMDNFGEPGNLLATQKLRVTSVSTYKVTFPKPFQLPTSYFIVLDNTEKLILPDSTSGELRFHHEWRSNSWVTWIYAKRWQYRIHTVTSNALPRLAGTGSPTIGGTFNFGLSNARGARPAIFLLGASDKAWGALRLPWRFIASCDLLVSGDILWGLVTDQSGNANFALTIPNDTGLVGIVAFQQFLVTDSGNAIGLIASNGGRLQIGEF
ncbi:MAG: hypothetical protein CMJ85_10985 [Planctomycetes bacterium]|nr:hypothetical protein [Planctomycetota bacterium]